MISEMIDEQLQAEADALEKMCDEVLSFNVQGGSREDHILSAEALLAFYERSARLQAETLQRMGDSLKGEGAMEIFRNAAEMHIKIAALLPEH